MGCVSLLLITTVVNLLNKFKMLLLLSCLKCLCLCINFVAGYVIISSSACSNILDTSRESLFLYFQHTCAEQSSLFFSPACSLSPTENVSEPLQSRSPVRSKSYCGSVAIPPVTCIKLNSGKCRRLTLTVKSPTKMPQFLPAGAFRRGPILFIVAPSPRG